MKKLISSLLTLVMLIPAQTLAETPANSILASVKSRIAVSADYDAFSSNSYADENGTQYSFSWENDDKSIEVTANESGIISGYRYDGAAPSGGKASESALYSAACGFVRQLNPDIYGKLKITGSNATGCFDIQRYENNIPVEGNSGYIAVSPDGKTLEDFFLTYTTGVEFEKPNRIINRRTAQKTYTDKIGFSLCYGSKYDGDRLVAFPIYTTDDADMRYISAASGKPVSLNDVSYVSDGQGAVPYPETPDEYTESNELEGMAGILSVKQTEAAVRGNKIINVPANYTLKSVSGFKENDDRCFYTLLFVGAKRSDYIEVMSDAKSGEIVHFGRTQAEGKNVITAAKAKKIAKNALAVLAPRHKNDYILNYSGENGVFTFVRNVNGIEFPANQIDIYVDMTNGNVVWYDFSYSDIKFPSLDKVISSDKISKIFFENSDFGPTYVLNCSKPGMTRYDRATLVYKFSSSDVTEFDAITGKPVWDNPAPGKVSGEDAVNTLR